MTPKDPATITAMQEYGGSFVRALGIAASYADPDNLARLKAAFPEYWARYAEMAQPRTKPDDGDEVQAAIEDGRCDGTPEGVQEFIYRNLK